MFYVKKDDNGLLSLSYEDGEGAMGIEGNEKDFPSYLYDKDSNTIFAREEIGYSFEVKDGIPIAVFDYEKSFMIRYEIIVNGKSYHSGTRLVEKATFVDDVTGEIVKEVVPSISIHSEINCTILLQSVDKKVYFDPFSIMISELIEDDNPQVEIGMNMVHVTVSKVQKQMLNLAKEIEPLNKELVDLRGRLEKLEELMRGQQHE